MSPIPHHHLQIIMSILENLMLGVLAILLLFWMLPGTKAALHRSKQTQSDWPSVLLPLGLVAMLVIFLIAMV